MKFFSFVSALVFVISMGLNGCTPQSQSEPAADQNEALEISPEGDMQDDEDVIQNDESEVMDQ